MFIEYVRKRIDKMILHKNNMDFRAVRSNKLLAEK